MQLVDEEDDFSVGLLDLLHDGLEALFELAAKLGAGDESADVQGKDALVLEVLGNVPAGDALGKPLHDGGLADACLADDDGVVLRAAIEDLHHPADFDVASDDGVELPFTGELREVGGVLLERLVAALGGGAGDAGLAADLLEGAVDALLGDAGFGKDVGRAALLVVGNGDEEVFDADVFVLEPLGLGVGDLHHAHDFGSGVDLDDVVLELRHLAEHLADAVAQTVGIDS